MSPGLGHALQRNWNAPPRCSDQPATESGKGPRRLPGCWEGSLDAAPEVGFPERRLVYRWRRVITPENVICPSVVPTDVTSRWPPIPPALGYAPAEPWRASIWRCGFGGPRRAPQPPIVVISRHSEDSAALY